MRYREKKGTFKTIVIITRIITSLDLKLRKKIMQDTKETKSNQ